ncbi:hypothetical protein HNR42_003357 [Deinobacterium chartae]|uniref:Polyketide cyclase / dehydrase and lipid transport n=1 Tax=Deinobacterium chartae TaxID=521158 RepID=A0A841I2I6_9DEIO|nr:SRPBCC family protein [Deinobacterium chartae]MBB6099897.1 hypothetical protein [Deinobacterium chartae]
MRVQLDIDILQPAEQIWPILADWTQDFSWRYNLIRVKQSRPGQVESGTLVFEVVRLLGRNLLNIAMITTLEEGRRCCFQAIGADYRLEGERSCTPTAQGTRVTLALDFELPARQRLLTPLVAYAWRRSERHNLRSLKTLIEGTPRTAHVASRELVLP